MAILLLGPAAAGGGGGDEASGRWRLASYAAAAATLLLALSHPHGWLGINRLGAISSVWVIGFSALAVSLLLKQILPRVAVSLDMFADFLGFVVVLDGIFGQPMNAKGGTAPVIHVSVGVMVVALASASMALYPTVRPVGYFVEAGSAGAILRRVLPITLLFPVLLVGLTALQRATHGALGQAATYFLLLSVVAFGAALLWVIAHTLDRMDGLRERTHRALHSSEERYRLLFEGNPHPMWVYDSESLSFLAVNARACEVYGYSQEQFMGMHRSDIDSADQHLVAGPTLRHRTAAGAELEVEVFSHPLNWEGRPAQVAFMHNVSEQLRAESQLRESDAQVHTLLDSTVEGIYAVDLNGDCIWSNPAAARMLRFASAEALIGRNIHELIHHTRADGTPYPESECAMMLATRRSETFLADEETVWRSDGTSFPADVRSSPLIRDGALAGAVVTLADATSRRQLQAQFQQSQKMEAVGRLAAGIAHDFNNLLTVIKGYADMLLRQPLEPSLRTRVANIAKAGDRAAELTQQLLAFSRQQVLQPKVLDLNQVMAEVEPLLRRVLGEDLNLATHFSPALDRVRADPGQISQVLMNLAVNARDAMPNGGCLTIESANVVLDAHYASTHPEITPGGYVMLAVTDNGCGMDAATVAHAFEPFFTTKPQGQGTGLGLATVFGIVKQSGGSVAVYSEVGRGTAIKIYLPSLAGAAAEAARGAADRSAPRGGETVLLVEDESSVRDLLQEVLLDCGYTVIVAESPQRALALSRESAPPIDLVVTDVVMPGMDGRKLVTELQRQPGRLRPGFAVLYVSGYPDKAISHNGDLDAGLSFIQKPFAPDALARKVRQVLDENARQAPGADRVGAA